MNFPTTRQHIRANFFEERNRWTYVIYPDDYRGNVSDAAAIDLLIEPAAFDLNRLSRGVADSQGLR